jgi:transposase
MPRRRLKNHFALLLHQRQAERVFAMDEARFGLKVWFRRRWCPTGVRPSWIVEDRYEWLWLYAAIEPTTGESFFLCLPRLDGPCFELFLQEFRHAFPETRVTLVCDNSGSHTSGQVAWPQGLTPLGLPAYSPELNPTERLFKELREALANQVFDNLDDLEQALTAALRPYWEHPQTLGRLTAYPWWRQGVAYIMTSSQ